MKTSLERIDEEMVEENFIESSTELLKTEVNRDDSHKKSQNLEKEQLG